MKKITYLIAPLMAIPLLVGCGGGEEPGPGPTPPEPTPTVTHTVTVSEHASENLKFTDVSGNELTKDKPGTAEEGKDYVFNIATTKDTDIIQQGGVYVFVGGDPAKFDYKTEDGGKTATITIPSRYITADVVLSGFEYKEGCYLCEIPYLLDTKIYKQNVYAYDADKGEFVDIIYDDEGVWYGWVPHNANTTLYIEFYSEGTGAYVPKSAENILLISDKQDKPVTADSVEWATYINYGTGYAVLAIDSYQDNVEVIGNYLSIAARGEGSSLLDYYSWAEIKKLASGDATKLFELGETKTVSINGWDHLVKLIHFGSNSLTFQFVTAISDENGDAIKAKWDTQNNYDFTTSTVYKKLTTEGSEILKPFPTDLLNVINEVPDSIKVGKYIGETPAWKADTFKAKLFPLATAEITDYNFGESVVSGEGALFQYYEGSQSYKNIRVATSAKGDKVAYWLRSPEVSYNEGKTFYVSTSGVVTRGGLNDSYAFAPAFVI